MPLHELGLALGTLITRCAPNVGPRTMAAIVSVESGGNPYAIDDDTTLTSYEPTNETDALMIVKRLTAQGHNFDAGIAQVNSSNFAAEHLTNDNVFDPCFNLQAGSHILARAYNSAKKTQWLGHPPKSLFESHAQEQLALYHAFSTYNSGDPQKSLAYADTVVAAAAGSDDILKNYTRLAPQITQAPSIAKPQSTTPPKALTFKTQLDTPIAIHALPKMRINLAAIAKNDGVLK